MASSSRLRLTCKSPRVSGASILTIALLRRSGFDQLPSDDGAGLEHDFQVEEDRQVLEIEQIHGDHLVERRLILAVYLPVSGQARQPVHAVPLPWLVMSKFIWRAGSRTDQDSSHRKAR